MMEHKPTSFDEVFSKYEDDPEFKKLDRELRPYFDLLVQIVNRRNELGLTQKELSEISGMHQSRISRIESGNHDIRLSTLIKIAEALDSEVCIHLMPTSDRKAYRVDREYMQIATVQSSYSKEWVNDMKMYTPSTRED